MFQLMLTGFDFMTSIRAGGVCCETNGLAQLHLKSKFNGMWVCVGTRVIYTAGRRSAHIFHITFGVFVVYFYFNFDFNNIANLCEHVFFVKKQEHMAEIN